MTSYKIGGKQKKDTEVYTTNIKITIKITTSTHVRINFVSDVQTKIKYFF